MSLDLKMELEDIREVDKLDDSHFRGENRINCWRITSLDLDRLVKNIKRVGKDPLIADVGCGRGLMSYLLYERYGYRVVALDFKERREELLWKPDEDGRLRFEGTDEKNLLHNALQRCAPDVIYCSFMPSGKNWTALFLKSSPKEIIHVFNKATGLRAVDERASELIKMFGDPYQLPKDYETVDEWRVHDYTSLGKKMPSSTIRVDLRKDLL